MAETQLGLVVKARDEATSVLKSIQNSAGSMMGSLGGIGLASMGVSALTNAARSLSGVFGIQLNSAVEDVNAQLMAFTKDGAVAKSILTQIRAEADKTPFAFDQMAKATAGLMPAARQAGVALMDLVRDAEVLAASNPAQGLEGAAFALREAVSGDFTSVIERFNLPRSYINQLKEQGVPALEIVRKAMKAMGYDMDLVSNLAQTGRGRWSTFMDTLDGIKRTLGEGLFEALKQDLADVQAWLDTNKDAITAWAQNAGRAIADAANTIRTTLVGLAEAWTGMSATGQRGVLSIAVLLLAGGPVLSAIVGMGRAVYAVGMAFDGLAVRVAAVAAIAASAGAAFEAAMFAATYGADKFADRFASNMGEIGNSITRFGGELANKLMPDNEYAKIMRRISDIKTQLHNAEQQAAADEQALQRAHEAVTAARKELNTNMWSAYKADYEEALATAIFKEESAANRSRILAEERAALSQEQARLEGQIGMAAVEAIGQTEVAFQNAVARTLSLGNLAVLTAEQQAMAIRAAVEGAGASDVALPFPTYTPPPKPQLPTGGGVFPALGGGGGGKGGSGTQKEKDYGASLNEIADAYAKVDRRAVEAADAVALWQRRVDATTLAQSANNDQLAAAQDELRRMGERVSELSARLSEAKQKLSDFGNVRLPGMQAWEDQLFAIDQQIKQLELRKLTGGGTGLDKQIDELRRQRDIVQKQGELSFDPGMRQLQMALQGGRPEMSLEAALAGISGAKGDVARYTNEVRNAEAAQKAHEKVVAALQVTAEMMNKTLVEQQAQLRAQEDRQSKVNEVLKTANDWFIKDRAEMVKSGAVGIETAGQIDKATREMMSSLDVYLSDASNQSIAELNRIWDAYQQRRAEAYAQLGTMQGLVGAPGPSQRLSQRFGANYAEWVGNGGSGSEAGFARHIQNLQNIGAFPKFHNGGIVPGSPGEERLIVAQGGERISRAGGSDIDALVRALASQPIVLQIDGQRMAAALRGPLVRTSQRNAGLGW